jgi:hypothetical protein
LGTAVPGTCATDGSAVIRAVDTDQDYNKCMETEQALAALRDLKA